jgi:hypothetical protein
LLFHPPLALIHEKRSSMWYLYVNT